MLEYLSQIKKKTYYQQPEVNSKRVGEWLLGTYSWTDSSKT